MTTEERATWKDCRWSSVAATFFPESDWEVFFDASESDYQGTVEIMASFSGYGWKDTKPYKYLKYSYGSCSGCDPWEGEPVEKAIEDMLRSVLPLDPAGARAHLNRIVASMEEYGDGFDERQRSAKARAAIEWIDAHEKEGAIT